MKMITESTFDILINESEDKQLFIEGIFATAEKENKNNRIYPKKILEREILSIMSKVNDNSCVGELNHPQDRSDVDLNEAAIKITSLKWDGNNVMGKAMVLTTPKGQIVRSLINDKVKVGISSRSLGTVSEGKVNNDLNLLCWDIVSNPSNHGSFVNGILEGIEFDNEIKDDKKLNEDKEEIKKLKKELKEIQEKYDNAFSTALI